MTQRDLDKKSSAQLRTLDAWLRKARSLVDSKVADARGHAVTAISETLKRTPDGRQTIRKASRSPSYAAAENRLTELWKALCGPSTASLEGLVRDAREELYREAFGYWVPFVPPEFRVKLFPLPLMANIKAVRGMVLHGMELRQEIGAPIVKARRSLLATVALAGSQAAESRQSVDLLKAWERRTVGSIFTTVRIVLSDSLGAADTQASRDLVHPDFRDERITLAGTS